jgi:hypothetical protein
MSVCIFWTLSPKILKSIHISMICHIDPMFRVFILILAIMFQHISFIVEMRSSHFSLPCCWSVFGHCTLIIFFRFLEFGQCWFKIQYLQLPCISAKAIHQYIVSYVSLGCLRKGGSMPFSTDHACHQILDIVLSGTQSDDVNV